MILEHPVVECTGYRIFTARFDNLIRGGASVILTAKSNGQSQCRRQKTIFQTTSIAPEGAIVLEQYGCTESKTQHRKIWLRQFLKYFILKFWTIRLSLSECLPFFHSPLSLWLVRRVINESFWCSSCKLYSLKSWRVSLMMRGGMEMGAQPMLLLLSAFFILRCQSVQDREMNSGKVIIQF